MVPETDTRDCSSTLRDLDFGEQALAQFAFERGVTYGAGQPVV